MASYHSEFPITKFSQVSIDVSDTLIKLSVTNSVAILTMTQAADLAVMLKAGIEAAWVNRTENGF